MSDIELAVSRYSQGFALLESALQEVEPVQLDLRPIPGKWSIREVVCHLADSEIVYADRMKRVIAEDNPTFFEADPDQFYHALRSEHRNVHDELSVIAVIRIHMVSILRSIPTEDYHRVGRHSLDGPMTLLTLLQRITEHIPHHVRFIDEKVRAIRG